MPSTEPSAGRLTPASSEVEQLQDEVDRLRASLAGQVRPARRWSRSRSVLVAVLIATVALLAPVSVLAVWADGLLSDTDRYLETVAPLADDPDVQDAVAERIEQVVLSHLDLQGAADQVLDGLERPGLPAEAAETLRALSAPLASGLRTFVRDRVDAAVRSDAFRQVWVDANRTAHDRLVGTLTGESDGAVAVDQGQVVVDVGALVGTVTAQLSEAGFSIADRVPEVDATFALVQSDDLARVQRLLGLVDALALALPLVALALFAAAVVLARDRARAVLVSGLVVAASMLVLGVALDVIRPLYLDALPAGTSAAAAGAVYDQLVSFLRLALRGVLVVALTVVVLAWLSRGSGSGATARRSLARSLAAGRRGPEDAGPGAGRLGTWLARFRGPSRVAVIGIAAVWYVMQTRPSGGTAVAVVLATGLVLLVVELLASDAPVPGTPAPVENPTTQAAAPGTGPGTAEAP